MDLAIKQEIDERKRAGNWNPKSRDPPSRPPKANWKKTQQGWAPARHNITTTRGRERGRHRSRGRSSRGSTSHLGRGRDRGRGRGRAGRNFSTQSRTGKKNFSTANGIPAEITRNKRNRTGKHISVKWTCRVCKTENLDHLKPCDGCGKKFQPRNDEHSKTLRKGPSERNHHSRILTKRRGGRVVGKRKVNKPKGPKQCNW